MTGQWVNNESENTLMCRLLVQVLLSEDEVPLHQHQTTNVLLLTLGYIVIWRYHLALFIILVVIFKQKVELNKWKSWSYMSHLKEQFMYSHSGHHPRCRWVWFFIRSEEMWSITSLAQQWIFCSEWVPSEWVQTADKNITVTHSRPSINVLRSEKLGFWKKEIHY